MRERSSSRGALPAPSSSVSNVASNKTPSPHTHRRTLQIHIMEGALVCPNCARRYPIKNGIPNMLLNEDEV
jgi:multifunctional methyltransferase subunit TRM112